MGAELGVADFLPGPAADEAEFGDGEQQEGGGAAERDAPENDVAATGGPERGEFALVAHIERGDRGRVDVGNEFAGAEGHFAVGAGRVGDGRRGEVDDGLAAAGVADEFVAQAGAGGIGLGGVGFRGALDGRRERAEEHGGGHSALFPVDGREPLGGREDDGGGGFDRRTEESGKGGEYEFGAGPGGDLVGGETAAIGGKGEGGFGPGRPEIAVEELGDGKRRKGLEGEFDLGGGFRRGRAGGHREGAREKEAVRQEGELGRGRAGAERGEETHESR